MYNVKQRCEFHALKTKAKINVAVHVTVGLPGGELGLGCGHMQVHKGKGVARMYKKLRNKHTICQISQINTKYEQ